jgi:anti-anti-sigma factor
MRMTEGTIRGFPLIVIEGDLEHSTKQTVRDAVDEILSGAYPPPTLFFDLTECPFIDSGGLGVFLSALRQLPASGWLGLIGASVGMKRVLTYAGLLDLERVRFFSSFSDATALLAWEKKPPRTQDPDAKKRGAPPVHRRGSPGRTSPGH